MLLGILTLVFLLGEGLLAAYFGVRLHALSLPGLRAGRIIQAISALGVLQMLVRNRQAPGGNRVLVERTSLRITAGCFYALALLLLVSSILSMVHLRQPISTLAGLAIALFGILGLWVLFFAKMRLGKKSGFTPILADARYNLYALLASLLILLSSVLWWIFGIPYVDVVGFLGLAYLSAREGKVTWANAKTHLRYRPQARGQA